MAIPFPTGDFSHLMEAATALATLTGGSSSGGDSATVPQSNPTMPKPTVSDEERTRKIRTAPTTSTTTPATSKEIFPQRLMAILNDKSISDIVTWVSHGRAFVIVRPDVFTEQVLPKYLPSVDSRSSTKYASFTRKLNRWGFRQATRGPDTGAFHHPLFLRDKPELCLEMVCQRSGDRKNSKTNLPAKKRMVMALTKESLDAMSQGNNHQSAGPTFASVSISDDSRTSMSQPSTIGSIQLSNSTSTVASTSSQQFPSLHCITNDNKLAQRALELRNEEERLRVAKVMLYHSYIEALQQKQGEAM